MESKMIMHFSFYLCVAFHMLLCLMHQSICPSQADVVLKWLNLRLWGFDDRVAQRLVVFSCVKMAEI